MKLILLFKINAWKDAHSFNVE